jgi:pyruvate,water dikinase
MSDVMMEAREVLIDWQHPKAAELGVVGGKGWHLAQLRRFGLPVPDGLVLPADWSNRWLAASGLGAKLDDAVQAARSGDTAPLEVLAPVLVQAPIPADLRDVIVEALTARGWLHQALAVRSSAIGEDAGQASFAGIYRSCLNVIGQVQVEAAIRDVWASLWMPTAVLYRQRVAQQGEGDDLAQMAVVIMPLLPAVASGIAFTCDPITGRDDQLLIHAQWGLGESLVGGQAAGDEYRFVDTLHKGLSLIDRQVGSKLCKTVVQAGGGTQRVVTPPVDATQLVLATKPAQELAELLQDAAQALDFANPFYDLEWVWDGQQFWLTQARPVTARPNYTYAGLQAQPTMWSRGNTCEIVPDPLSPIDWSQARRTVNLMLDQAFVTGSYPVLPGVQRAALFHGRIYLNVSTLQWELYDGFGIEPDMTNAMMGGHQPNIDLPAPTKMQRVQRSWRMVLTALRGQRRRKWGQADIDALMARSFQEFRQAAPTSREALRAAWQAHLACTAELADVMFMQASSGGSAYMLIQQLEKLFPSEGHSLATALLAGGAPSVTARQGYDLMALAQQARQHTAAVAGDAADISWFGQLPPDDAFRRAFDNFLRRYGHRGLYETYLRNPRWREDPRYLLQMLAHLSADEAALRARQSNAAAAAYARIRQKASWFKAKILQGIARQAHTEGNDREAARSALTSAAARARRTLLAIGHLLVESSTLDAPEDIFELTVPEVDRALTGKISAAGLKARVAKRKVQFTAWMAETPPDVISEQGSSAIALDDKETARHDGPHYQGVPTGTGKVRGTARLLYSPEDGQRLLPGDILVARSTDPGWTPLFLKAGGVVVETGGYLSHSAIVARELAIPTVVNLPGIFGEIRDGEMLEVDGLRGTVTRL